MSDEKPSVESTFAANLKTVREQQGLSQEQLADRMTKAGYSWHQATVYKVEAGTREVKLGEAEALSGILGVSVGVLMQASDAAVEVSRIVEARRQLQRKREAAIATLSEWLAGQETLREAVGMQPAIDWSNTPDDVDPWGYERDVSKSVRNRFSKGAIDAIKDAIFEGPEAIVAEARDYVAPPF